jgi:hypothetical protein
MDSPASLTRLRPRTHWPITRQLLQGLTDKNKNERCGMDNRDCLAHYPFVVVRIACRVCSRARGLPARAACATFGPEIGLRDLTDRFSYDCLWRAEARSKKGKSACGVYPLRAVKPTSRSRWNGGFGAVRSFPRGTT